MDAQHAAAETATPEEGAGLQRERRLAAISYVLTWLTGLIILLVADHEDRYARWHAIQSIGLGIAWALIGTVAGITSAIIGLVAFGSGTFGWGLAPFSPFPLIFGGLATVLQLALLVVIIVLAVKAYNGETVRIPLLARIADDNA